MLNALNGSMGDETVEDGTTLREFLNNKGVTNMAICLVRVNREELEMDYFLQQEDYIAISPRNIEAAAPTCEIRKLRKYLRHLGWVPEAGTVGDHENWRSPNDVVLQLNPDKQDSKVVDYASHRKCAMILGMNWQTLYENVARHG